MCQFLTPLGRPSAYFILASMFKMTFSIIYVKKWSVLWAGENDSLLNLWKVPLNGPQPQRANTSSYILPIMLYFSIVFAGENNCTFNYNVFMGGFQKLLSIFFPLRGGEYPPHSAKLCWAQWLSVKEKKH